MGPLTAFGDAGEAEIMTQQSGSAIGSITFSKLPDHFSLTNGPTGLALFRCIGSMAQI